MRTTPSFLLESYFVGAVIYLLLQCCCHVCLDIHWKLSLTPAMASGLLDSRKLIMCHTYITLDKS